jgi:alpha-L-arabinofuranosidase
MAQAQITINTQQPGATIAPEIYGHFAEHLGRCIYGGIWVGEDSSIPNDQGIRLDTVAALRKLELPVLRWPGGCFADNYHWQDGIGPRKDRPTRLNIWWQQGEPNTFGTHEFMRFCRLIGTQPYFCANVGSGTVEEARGWVEYCNASQDTTLTRQRAANGDPAPFKVRYWGVGNENWGCGGEMSAEGYANLYRQFATYMRNTGGDVFLIACGSHDNNHPDWDARFLDTLKGSKHLVDAIALHHYTGWGVSATEFTPDEYLGRLLANIAAMETHIKQSVQVARAHSTECHQIRVIMDEWGTWYREATTENGLLQLGTMTDAVFAGMCFHMFHRHAADLVMTNIAQTINVLQALILTEGPRMCCTPTYWLYDMFRLHQGAQHLPVSFQAASAQLSDGRTVPLFSASASQKDGKIALSLVNADTANACDVTVALDTGAIVNTGTARLLSSDRPNAQNTPSEPDHIAPSKLSVTVEKGQLKLTLPPAAVAIVEIG